MLDDLVVVLVRPEGPHNVGGVARLCGNFGASLRLVAPACDLSGSDALRMAHPCQQALLDAPRFATLPDALAGVSFALATSAKIAVAAAAPALDVARARLLRPTPPERLALVFGAERTGLTKEDAACCSRIVRLETPGPVESLNLTSAVAVTLALFAEAARADQPTRAPAAAREALERAWSEALTDAGFHQRTSAAAFAPRLRELLGKMDLSERDTELMRELLVRLRAPR